MTDHYIDKEGVYHWLVENWDWLALIVTCVIAVVVGCYAGISTKGG